MSNQTGPGELPEPQLSDLLSETDAAAVREVAKRLARRSDERMQQYIAQHVAEHHPAGVQPADFPGDPEAVARLFDLQNLRSAWAITEAVAKELERMRGEILREAALTASRMVIAHGNDDHARRSPRLPHYLLAARERQQELPDEVAELVQAIDQAAEESSAEQVAS